MNLEDLREYCISLPDVEECFPFDDVTLVMKTGGKMFALIPLDEPETCISVKCDPDLAVELREKYSCVQPAFHMNKTYWNTIFISPEITRKQSKEWIKHSHELIRKKLPKKKNISKTPLK